MRKTFIETSELTEWVGDYGAESRGGDHYVSSPIPRHSLERLGWGSKLGDERGHPHFFGIGEWVAPSNPLVPESGWPHPIPNLPLLS